MASSSNSAQNQASTNTVTQIPDINSVSSPLMGKPPVYWVIDTGTTHHITPTFANFYSFSTVKPISMKLPNGQTTITNVSGSVKISENIVLKDVYYIPTFNVNLIYVAKLIDSSNCHLNFTNDSCFIVQNSPKRTIGTADRHGDLYVIQAQATYTFLVILHLLSLIQPHFGIID